MTRAFRLTAPQLKLVENDVERQCLDLLRLRGYWAARLHAGTFRSIDGQRWIRGVEKGTPDYGAIHEVYPGFLLETKRPGANLTPAQSTAINNLRMGYRLAVCAVDGVAAFVRWLDQHETQSRNRWREFLRREAAARGP